MGLPTIPGASSAFGPTGEFISICISLRSRSSLPEHCAGCGASAVS
ncbi:MAG: hypothetical protein E6G85_24865 [Alphaproteobacteria bacterium]|nr:MAG: hypothetical protein E6G85_24865 [Alphaproteobacteria bacterium]